MSHNYGVSSVGDYLLCEGRRIELVQHDGLTILTLRLVGTIILAEVQRKVLALSLGEVRHQAFGLIRVVRLVKSRLQHDWVA